MSKEFEDDQQHVEDEFVSEMMHDGHIRRDNDNLDGNTADGVVCVRWGDQAPWLIRESQTLCDGE